LRQKAHDPKMRVRLATILLQLGNVRGWLGQTEEALATLGEAIGVTRELVAEHPDLPDNVRLLAGCHFARGKVLAKSRRLEETVKAYREAEALLDGLVRNHGAQPGDRYALALFHTAQCEWLNGRVRFRDSEAHARRSLELLGPLAKEFPNDTRYRSATAAAHNIVAITLKRAERRQEAREHYEAALELQRRLHDDSPGDSLPKAALATGHRNLALFYRDGGQIDEGRRHYAKARRLYEELARDFPDMHYYHGELAEIHHGLAICATLEEKWADARDLLQRAVREQRITLAVDSQHRFYRDKMCQRLIPLADVHMRLGAYREAAEAAFEARRYMTQPRMCADATQLLLGCVDRAAGDQRVPRPERKELADRYAGRAVEVLRSGAEQGLVNAADLKKMNLVRLQGREEYRTLLAELETKAKGR
jgi:tetratricopeptide (TPR) repeat protein